LVLTIPKAVWKSRKVVANGNRVFLEMVWEQG
jgi:hypothetical protein